MTISIIFYMRMRCTNSNGNDLFAKCSNRTKRGQAHGLRLCGISKSTTFVSLPHFAFNLCIICKWPHNIFFLAICQSAIRHNKKMPPIRMRSLSWISPVGVVHQQMNFKSFIFRSYINWWNTATVRHSLSPCKMWRINTKKNLLYNNSLSRIKMKKANKRWRKKTALLHFTDYVEYICVFSSWPRIRVKRTEGRKYQKWHSK